jgi:hypothetical protein
MVAKSLGDLSESGKRQHLHYSQRQSAAKKILDASLDFRVIEYAFAEPETPADLRCATLSRLCAGTRPQSETRHEIL